ncbi:uncharacterized protein EI90DRAFT_3039060 [Cantharellus anzutake]|uniref:uncharacterized protein n=1 Tax=Cantharellus anzutake TaxID=1750568 RepID=UPI001907600F|nr:uncharacterized protein EI90DRAFT_3039060 [Cantharellus anzutake]KAF8338769.1 hypothetical protein EI90DRAFT_3039060 [Cantharellus anzutake]
MSGPCRRATGLGPLVTIIPPLRALLLLLSIRPEGDSPEMQGGMSGWEEMGGSLKERMDSMCGWCVDLRYFCRPNYRVHWWQTRVNSNQQRSGTRQGYVPSVLSRVRAFEFIRVAEVGIK